MAYSEGPRELIVVDAGGYRSLVQQGQDPVGFMCMHRNPISGQGCWGYLPSLEDKYLLDHETANDLVERSGYTLMIYKPAQ